MLPQPGQYDNYSQDTAPPGQFRTHLSNLHSGSPDPSQLASRVKKKNDEPGPTCLKNPSASSPSAMRVAALIVAMAVPTAANMCAPGDIMCAEAGVAVARDIAAQVRGHGAAASERGRGIACERERGRSMTCRGVEEVRDGP